jgi:hypothetical protein
VFTAQQSSAWVFYALREASAGGGVDRRLAYVPPMSETPAVDLDLAGTWASAGVYVFLGARPNSDKAFLAAFRSWQAISAPKNLRLLWLEDPNSSPDTWNPSSIRITKPNEQGGTIAAAARIALKNYVVVFERGCTLSLDGESPGFTLAAPEASTEKAYLTVERRRSLRGAPPCYPLPATGAELSLRGPAAGAIAFRLEIDAPSKANAPTCFDVLDVACRYFYPAADRSGAPVDSLSYPIFDGRASATALAAVLDPTAPLSDRTAFSIEPGDKPLATFFRTTVGGRINLKPLADASLRFELRPDSSEDTGSFYLVPTGRFEIVLPEAAAGAEQLLCGVCAAEYVTLNPERTVLTFVPQQAAFAPLFEPSPTQPNDDAVEAPRLDFDAKTSWISLTAAEPLVYYAQPTGAVFYGRTHAGPAPENETLLPFFPVPAGRLPAGQADQVQTDNAFPLVPYAGIDASEAAAAMAFETEVLAQERRELVYELTNRVETPVPSSDPVDPASALTAVTPVGFVARFSENKDTWESLTLARMDNELLALQNVVDPLRAALLTNQQFLVISDPRAFAAYFLEQNRIAIQGWVFNLDPREWERHGTIVLIKNCDHTVAELIDDVGTWALPEEFNSAPSLTQQSLEQIIADARHEAAKSREQETATESSYHYFVNTVVDDPTWNGVLFLNCFVPPADLPAELSDLAAGLDEQLFFAHHLGINQTAVRGADLSTGNSSLFGLIAYSDELRSPGSLGTSFDFQVLEMEVLFANSEIQHFSSSIAVTLMQMFGARATAVGSDTGNALILDGTYQRRGDRSVYVYRNQDQVVFDLDDRILKRVKLEQAEFGSATQDAAPDPADDDNATVVAQFTFRGTLAFGELKERIGSGTFDLFSYDELAFSKLALEMRYPRMAPRAVSFRLDPSDVAFGSATARPGSLANDFPVCPISMIADGDAAEPSDLGYMSVGVPGLEMTHLDSRWFGIVFDVDLGTPGALAGAVGFTASLAVVWSASTSAEPVFVGLKMPGSSGASNELSLMGVLKLTIYQLQLLHADREFILKLTGMTLKVMGKTLPPGATFDFFLFGDSAAAGGVPSLGWYGAYKRPPDTAGDDDDAKLSNAAPALIERRPWSRAELLDALQNTPEQ